MTLLTNTHRGAKIAYDLAAQRILQPDLFGDALSEDFWGGILEAAEDQLIECAFEREACLRGRGASA